MNRLALCMFLTLLSASAPAAVTFNVMELESAGGPEKAFLAEPDALRRDAKGQSILLPEKLENPTHQAMAAILAAGMPFSEPAVRRELGAILSWFPASCQSASPPLSVTLLVTQIEHIDNFVPGVVDKRRIAAIYIGGCLAEDLPECGYDMTKTAEVDFHIGMLKGVLNDCRGATQAAIESGAPFADTVHRTHPSQKRKP